MPLDGVWTIRPQVVGRGAAPSRIMYILEYYKYDDTWSVYRSARNIYVLVRKFQYTPAAQFETQEEAETVKQAFILEMCGPIVSQEWYSNAQL